MHKLCCKFAIIKFMIHCVKLLLSASVLNDGTAYCQYVPKYNVSLVRGGKYIMATFVDTLFYLNYIVPVGIVYTIGLLYTYKLQKRCIIPFRFRNVS